MLPLATLALDIVMTCHVVLYKRDTRAAIAWFGFIWLVPIVGSLLYLWLGINRIKRFDKSLRPIAEALPDHAVGHLVEAGDARLQSLGEHLPNLARVIERATQHPLLAGNQIKPLNDETAYDTMLAAIRSAQRSVSLATYIFDNDAAGQQFCDALAQAVARGVEVRVIVDDVGAKYSWPSILRVLRRAEIPHATFMPRLTPFPLPYSNMRNHRKILVVDGTVGFTGGMNIRAGHASTLDSSHPIADMHFQVAGPVVAQLQHVFAEDWMFCHRERLGGSDWFPALSHQGQVIARGIPDGPDEDFENLRTALLAALACAERSVHVQTPYFLPDAGLLTALNLAAMRGVDVHILLPEVNNLRFVQWASTAQLWQVLEQGCQVWLVPPPFDHTKLTIVDEVWTLFGSSNWDPRSLRLNFEFDVECYDRELGAQLTALLEAKRSKARRVTLEDVDGRPMPVRLRDGLARLLTPYL